MVAETVPGGVKKKSIDFTVFIIFMKSEDIILSPIHVLDAQRKAGNIKTRDIVSAVMNRRRATEPVLNAYIHQIPDEVCLEQADCADDKLRRGEPVHILEGMPIGVKDIFNVIGTPLTCASKILTGYVSPYESTVTSRLKDAGYLMTGKLNMDEFAMGSSTENSAYGAVRNPWDTDRVPGGSSGGSAAAVAAGSCLAALGTDTGGSIRQPAMFTGTFGIKPTYGFCSRYGMSAFASSFDQAGPITKDVEDSAVILQQIGGFDERDSTSLNIGKPDLVSGLKQGIEGMRVGVIQNLDLSVCDEEIRQNFEQSVDLFRKNGCQIVSVNIEHIQHSIAVYYIIACSEASSNLGRYDGIRYGHRSPAAAKIGDVFRLSRDEGFGNEVKLRILLGTFALSSGYYDAYYSKAKKIQSMYRRQFQQIFSDIDILLTPVSPVRPFKLNEKMDDPLQMYLADVFTVIVNLAGIPAASVPSGFSAQKLPLGIQLMAGHLKEADLLRTAYWFEKQAALEYPPQKI
ncbi:hypothetical protein CHS0354_035327 [Potamilus streckersoni]|uniref:Glutamyl-tRNA(Gln) amidotransferase subunit A, mitochondrial n=1 Tax=Potamilus streckersoni TaxID=2493646 RepID=A0AAE0S2T0_9BIVA|nr:hypothetical protein CHS0354_035327 [Potamilus streckersoni]